MNGQIKQQERIEYLFKKLTKCYQAGLLNDDDMQSLDYILHHHMGKIHERYAELVVHDEYGMERRYRVDPKTSYKTDLEIEEEYTVHVREYHGL